MLDERHEAARRILEGARAQLDALVQALMEEETVGEDELTRIIGPRPTSDAPLLARARDGGRAGAEDQANGHPAAA